MLVRIVAAIVLVYVIPFLLMMIFDPIHSDNVNDSPNTTISSESPMTEIVNQENKGNMIAVMTDTGCTPMPLEEYILCVTLAEMPADFELEALKAQAVVARTYTIRRMEEPKHETGAVCTNSACCQAYISVDSYLESGGNQVSVEKVRSAVEATAGQVLTYQGAYIEATYFSCSGGKTEDAQAVWGSDVPYLQSVESPGEEMATHYTDTVSFSKNEFLNKLQLEAETVRIGRITYTEGGGVLSVEICGKRFQGTEVRSMLGLRSTAFVITAAGEKVTITTKGFGHRVGMSQYGAEAMAAQGTSYDEILLHYYQGTELTMLSG